MSLSASDGLLRRLERDTSVSAVALALGAAAVWPSQPSRALGVLGGFALMVMAFTGIRAGVDTVVGGLETPDAGREAPASLRVRQRLGFVKFFTRHGMLAACAYVMIARFEFDPVAMLAGVTTPAIAAVVEFVRSVRARSTGRHSRIS